MYFSFFLIMSPCKRTEPFISKTNWITFTLGCFVPSLVEIGQVIPEKKIFSDFVSVFSLFRYHLSFVAFHLNRCDFLSLRDALCKVWLKWPNGSGEDDFLILSCIFTSPLLSLWEKARQFIWTDLKHHHQRMLYAMFGWNWPSGSWEDSENVKSLQQRRWQQRRRRTTKKFHLNFQCRWAKKEISGQNCWCVVQIHLSLNIKMIHWKNNFCYAWDLMF